MEIEIIDSNGNLIVPISIVYALLKRKLATLNGRYLVLQGDISLLTSLKLDPSDKIPEIGFCPVGEPDIIDVNDILSEVCIEVYKYFEDRCAACAIKAFSILGEVWFLDEQTLIKLLEIARDYYLPIEWSRGNIVLTTCPENYDIAREQLKPGDYVKGLERLREAIHKFSRETGYRVL